ncbi:MAG: HAMP domain-containing histidine kinase [Clostridia bacterium]|nr:HAMP domain-containing histidine kinase [Clostridia bacterium]
MFKSTFAKYLTAFVIILLISFLILSSIITTTIREYVTENKEESLLETTTALSNQLSKVGNTLDNYVLGFGYHGLIPLIIQDDDIKIMITDENGNILLTTVRTITDEDGFKQPITWGNENLGSIDLRAFKNTSDAHMRYQGRMESVGKENYLMCAKPIKSEGSVTGYAISLISTSQEDAMVLAARRTIISSSCWVMLAAVVALYLITERVITPLKNMTKATKKFAKGDFSTRVTICGHDEIAELGEAFNHMAESLDNFEKMRNSFLANVSHDLRTPMTTIAGFIDGITSGAIPPEKHEYYLGVISAEVHRLSRLVADLLDISRLESGERKFNFVSFDVAEMARIILISFEQKIGEKNLDVIFETEEDSVFVVADRDAIHQVLYNLIHNAIKFSKQNGKLAIYISKLGSKKIRVSVYDEGQGIPKEELPLIFDRFYKTDKSRGLDKSGVGLGLYICKTIIDAHGEEIHAESPSDNGAEFWFSLKEGSASQKERNRDI